MNQCECLEKCPFFNDKMKESPALSQIYKKRFCLEGDKNNCARYRVRQALGPENVPGDLYPNQTERADKIIGK